MYNIYIYIYSYRDTHTHGHTHTHSNTLKFVYYESIKRELKTKPIYECLCDERPKHKVEESTRVGYTGVHDKTN